MCFSENNEKTEEELLNIFLDERLFLTGTYFCCEAIMELVHLNQINARQKSSTKEIHILIKLLPVDV